LQHEQNNSDILHFREKQVQASTLQKINNGEGSERENKTKTKQAQIKGQPTFLASCTVIYLHFKEPSSG